MMKTSIYYSSYGARYAFNRVEPLIANEKNLDIL